jgi:RNA polymerase primary sigma factor
MITQTPNNIVETSRPYSSLRAKAREILGQEYPYMDSAMFRRKDIESKLFGVDCEPQLPDSSWYQPTYEDIDKNDGITPTLMNAEQERTMFLRFNYAKRKLSLLRKKFLKEGLNKSIASNALLWRRRHELYREYLVRTNLALVLAMAKRTRLQQVDFAEIISEGNMALLRAIEKFNVDRGFKFSTYACRAILKAYSRSSLKQLKHRTRFPVEFEPDLERSDWSDRRHDTIESECVDELKNIIDRNLADLTQIEQTVIQRRFNWKEAQENPLTLEEVGKIIGVTKERVRQIQNKALAKIRQVMEEGVLRVVQPEKQPEAGEI